MRLGEQAGKDGTRGNERWEPKGQWIETSWRTMHAVAKS